MYKYYWSVAQKNPLPTNRFSGERDEDSKEPTIDAVTS